MDTIRLCSRFRTFSEGNAICDIEIRICGSLLLPDLIIDVLMFRRSATCHLTIFLTYLSIQSYRHFSVAISISQITYMNCIVYDMEQIYTDLLRQTLTVKLDGLLLLFFGDHL